MVWEAKTDKRNRFFVFYLIRWYFIQLSSPNWLMVQSQEYEC